MTVLPRRIEERLRRDSERIEVSEEELILEAPSKTLNEPLDPEARVEMYLKLSEKYLRDSEELLARKDYVQASGKAWEAASQIVKALAAREEEKLGVVLAYGSILMNWLRDLET